MLVRFLVPSALGLTLTLASACNPDEVRISDRNPEDVESPGPTVLSDGGKKAVTDMDGGARDAGNASGTGAADGAVLGDAGAVSDAGNGDFDAGSPDSGAATTDASATDASATDARAIDARASDAGANDASRNDAEASDAGADAGRDAGNDAGADAGACEINDPRFGCGTQRSVDWIHFASGLDIDTKYGRAWSPVIEASTLQDLRSRCQDLSIDQLNEFEVPEVDDVRTLAAGCGPTLPEGSCTVQNGVVLPSDSGACSCDTGVGPNAGKFCRAEVPDCVTLWTETNCGVINNECPARTSWFYDVRTGSLVLAAAGQGVAQDAKGRCVHGINYTVP